MPEKEAQRVLEKSQAATQEEAIKIFNEHKRRLVKLRKEKVSGNLMQKILFAKKQIVYRFSGRSKKCPERENVEKAVGESGADNRRTKRRNRSAEPKEKGKVKI